MARILLLDDDIAEITAVKRLVARTAHRAQLATSAADAAGAIARDPPDLLIVASACDAGQGLAVVRQASAEGAPLPVIVLGDAAGLPAAVRTVGVPVDPEQLGRTIDVLLRSPGRPSAATSPGRTAAALGPSARSAVAGAGDLADPRGWADELVGAGPAAPAEPALEDRQPPSDVEARRRAGAEEEERLRDAIASARAELEQMRRRQARAPAPPAGSSSEPAPPRATTPAGRASRASSDAAPATAATSTPRAPPAAAPPVPSAALPAPPPPSVAAPAPHAPPATSAAPASSPASPAPSAAAAGPLASRGAPPAPPPLPPPPEELRSGTLAELPAPRLLALAAAARLAGRLEVDGEVTRSLWFEDGRVVGAASGDPAERVEALAVRLGLVTREQRQQVAAQAATLPAGRAALLLLDAGFLKPAELSGLVRRRTEEVVFGIFGDAGARFRWAAEEVPADERGPVERPTLALAVEGVRRRWSAARLDAVVGSPDTILGPIPDGPPAEALALSPEERRLAALVDGLRTLGQIERASPLDALATRQVLAALVQVGALAVRRLVTRASAEAARAIDRARLADKLDQARRCDYFTVLGLPRSSTSHEVREAASRLEEDLAEGRHADGGGPALALGDLLQVVRDARAVLGDDGLRQAYLAALGE